MIDMDKVEMAGMMGMMGGKGGSRVTAAPARNQLKSKSWRSYP
jgi:hypothetical protein